MHGIHHGTAGIPRHNCRPSLTFQVGWGFLQEVIWKLVQAQGCLTVNLIPPEKRAERKVEWEIGTVKGNREEMQQDLMSSYPLVWLSAHFRCLLISCGVIANFLCVTLGA